MTRTLKLTGAAFHDLQAIGDFIARDDPARAERFILRLRERCARLLDFPEAAPLRPDILPDIRLVVQDGHLILYALKDDAVVIERIVHGARHLPDVLADQPPSGGMR